MNAVKERNWGSASPRTNCYYQPKREKVMKKLTEVRTTYYDNGHKRTETNFKDGKENGLHTMWYENGQKFYEVTLKDGIEDELETHWHKNGQKMHKWTIKDGVPKGLSTTWNENGEKIGQVHH